MNGDFDWFGEKDRDAIVLEYQPPTAVYRTKAGNIIIRQKAEETEEYDPQIFLNPQGALAVAWALIEDAHLVGLPQPSHSLMAESEHWPPPPRRTTEPDSVTKDGNVAETEPGPLLRVMQEAAE